MDHHFPHSKNTIANVFTQTQLPNQGRIQGGAAGGGRPSLRLGIRRPINTRCVLFLLMSELLSLLSLLRGALLRTRCATLPPLASGILIHTRAPSSTPIRAPSSTPGRFPPHQGAFFYTRALSSVTEAPSSATGAPSSNSLTKVSSSTPKS